MMGLAEAPPSTETRLLAKEDSVAKGAFVTMLRSVASVFLGVLASIVIARALGPEFKGPVDLVNATVALAVMVWGFSLQSGITYTIAKGGVNVRRLLSILTVVGLIQGALAWLAASMLSRTSLCKAFMPPEYASWAGMAIGIATAATLASGYYRAIFSALRRFVVSATLDFVARTAVLTAMVAGVLLALGAPERGAALAITLMVAANVLVAVGTFWFSRRAWRGNETGPLGLPEACRYSLPCYLGNLTQFLNYRMDVFFVSYFVGLHELGLYATAVSLAQLLWIPSQSMQAVLFPKLTSRGNRPENAQDTARVNRLVLSASVLGGVTMGVCGIWLVPAFYGAKFQDSVILLQLLLPGVVVFVVSTVLAAYIAALGKPQVNASGSLLGFVVTLVLDVLLIPRFGAVGAAIASSVSYTATTIFLVIYFSRESQIRLADLLLPKRADWHEVAKTVRGAAMFHRLLGK
jgi:O-antigen/teichoic acid export membrane protein